MFFGRLYIIYPFSDLMWGLFRTSRIKQDALLEDGERLQPMRFATPSWQAAARSRTAEARHPYPRKRGRFATPSWQAAARESDGGGAPSLPSKKAAALSFSGRSVRRSPLMGQTARMQHFHSHLRVYQQRCQSPHGRDGHAPFFCAVKVQFQRGRSPQLTRFHPIGIVRTRD